MHIHERENWTAFRWNDKDIALPLEEANRKRGRQRQACPHPLRHNARLTLPCGTFRASSGSSC
ncbi:MAG: hypothetical protein LUC86_05475 [Prevotellaceae bacterium]|nr:hypothetical protein [Prevotellaceae bacterium]